MTRTWTPGTADDGAAARSPRRRDWSSLSTSTARRRRSSPTRWRRGRCPRWPPRSHGSRPCPTRSSPTSRGAACTTSARSPSTPTTRVDRPRRLARRPVLVPRTRARPTPTGRTPPRATARSCGRQRVRSSIARGCRVRAQDVRDGRAHPHGRRARSRKRSSPRSTRWSPSASRTGVDAPATACSSSRRATRARTPRWRRSASTSTRPASCSPAMTSPMRTRCGCSQTAISACAWARGRAPPCSVWGIHKRWPSFWRRSRTSAPRRRE